MSFSKERIFVGVPTHGIPPADKVNVDGSRMPVGVTVIAGMKVDEGKDAFVTRVVHSLVNEAIRTRGVVFAKHGTVQIVESLVWPFVVKELSRTATLDLRRKFQTRMVKSLLHTVQVISLYESEDDREQSFVKYWLDIAMCNVFRDNQRPVRPDWLDVAHPLFVGFMARGVRGSVSRRKLDFIYSLSKGSKRLWPALGEKKLAKALETHKERIGTAFRGSVPEDFLRMVSQTAKEIFTRKRLGIATKILPSMHACLQASRRQGGASALFAPMDTGVVQFGPIPDEMDVSASVEHQLNFAPRRYLSHKLDAWRQSTWESAYEQACERFNVPLNGRFDAFGLPKTENPALTVEVAAIPEPGKFRIITKGDGFLYTALQPLQGQMLAAWKSTAYSTMRDDDLTEKVQSIDRTVDAPYWCSGDYEAATDLLQRQCTLRALAELQGRTPLADLAYESVQPGWVVYPDKTKVWGGEGQLMGHPLSFPLLCVINLAVYRFALTKRADDLRREGMANKLVSEWLRTRWDAVIVNGDDILFKCDLTLYGYFIEVSKSAGLQISVGKNYLSPDMCMINSQIFHRRNGSMRRLGYLNLKFITNSSLKSGDSQATPVGIARDVQKMIDLAPWTESVVPAVFDRWRDLSYLFRGFQPNWYMPCELGGFGLRKKPGQVVKYTRIQRKVAALFLSRPELALIAQSTSDFGSFDVVQDEREFKLYPPLEAAISIMTGEFPTHFTLAPTGETWSTRVLMCRRAAGQVDTEGEWSTKHLSKGQLTRLGFYRLNPIDENTIEWYRDAVVFASPGIPVPPLSAINLSAARRESRR